MERGGGAQWSYSQLFSWDAQLASYTPAMKGIPGAGGQRRVVSSQLRAPGCHHPPAFPLSKVFSEAITLVEELRLPAPIPLLALLREPERAHLRQPSSAGAFSIAARVFSILFFNFLFKKITFELFHIEFISPRLAFRARQRKCSFHHFRAFDPPAQLQWILEAQLPHAFAEPRAARAAQLPGLDKVAVKRVVAAALPRPELG